MKISDHVVLRYMQRKFGVDVDAVRREIETTVDTRGTRRVADFAGRVPWRMRVDGMVFCMRGDTVTTCFRDRAVRFRGSRAARLPSPRRTGWMTAPTGKPFHHVPVDE